MYDYLRIQYRAQQFLFRFTRRDAKQDYFVHASLNHQFPPPRPTHSGFLVWIIEYLCVGLFYLYYSICCFVVVPMQSTSYSNCETLGQYLARIHLPDHFVRGYILPLISSVATCSYVELLNLPASDIVTYKRKTYGQNHYVVDGGVRRVRQILSEGLEMQVNARVTSVTPNLNDGSDAVEVKWVATCGDNGSVSEDFDKVILAVSPDVVQHIFAPLSSQMSLIPTTQVECCVFQSDNTAWFLNLRQAISSAAETIHLISTSESTEAVHEQSIPGVCVSTSPLSAKQSAQSSTKNIIHRTRFTRVLRTPISRQVVNDIFRPRQRPFKGSSSGSLAISNDAEKPLLCEVEKRWMNGDNNVFLVGGWCWDGMVLLEGCIVSAMRVARELSVAVPWEAEN